jgi:hypothetical protein
MAVLYCSTQCQSAHWTAQNGHRTQCAAFAVLRQMSPLADAVAAAAGDAHESTGLAVRMKRRALSGGGGGGGVGDDTDSDAATDDDDGDDGDDDDVVAKVARIAAEIPGRFERMPDELLVRIMERLLPEPLERAYDVVETPDTIAAEMPRVVAGASSLDALMASAIENVSRVAGDRMLWRRLHRATPHSLRVPVHGAVPAAAADALSPTAYEGERYRAAVHAAVRAWNFSQTQSGYEKWQNMTAQFLTWSQTPPTGLALTLSAALDVYRAPFLWNIVGAMQHVRHLALWYNYNLQALPRSIKQLTARLTTLDIDATPELRLRHSMFGNGAAALRFLTIRGAQLRALPSSAVQLTALEELDLSDNQFDVLPPVILGFAALRHLYINNNLLTTLPGDFWLRMTRLQRLKLRSNRLWRLPGFGVGVDSAGRALSPSPALLETLNVSKNALTALPDDIGALQYLEKLVARKNRLTTLPTGIGALPVLTFLELADNRLTRLPDSFGQLTALRELNLNENPLTALPDTIGNATALELLFVRTTFLTTLPTSMRHLKYLRAIDAENNPLVPYDTNVAAVINSGVKIQFG